MKQIAATSMRRYVKRSDAFAPNSVRHGRSTTSSTHSMKTRTSTATWPTQPGLFAPDLAGRTSPPRPETAQGRASPRPLSKTGGPLRQAGGKHQDNQPDALRRLLACRQPHHGLARFAGAASSRTRAARPGNGTSNSRAMRPLRPGRPRRRAGRPTSSLTPRPTHPGPAPTRCPAPRPSAARRSLPPSPRRSSTNCPRSTSATSRTRCPAPARWCRTAEVTVPQT